MEVLIYFFSAYFLKSKSCNFIGSFSLLLGLFNFQSTIINYSDNINKFFY